jgi:hypothetical protein
MAEGYPATPGRPRSGPSRDVRCGCRSSGPRGAWGRTLARTAVPTLAREHTVATDLHVTGSDTVVVPVRTHRRRAVLLLGLALFQFWLWGTRIVNLLEDAGSFGAAFVAVHLVLYLAAIGAGVLLAVLGTRMWREAREGTPR